MNLNPEQQRTLDSIRDVYRDNVRLREQIAWTVARCNAAMGDGFQGTPNSAVAAVCDELERLRSSSKAGPS